MQLLEKLSTDEVGSGQILEKNSLLMKMETMNYWLCRFMLEARVMSGEENNPDSFYPLYCSECEECCKYIRRRHWMLTSPLCIGTRVDNIRIRFLCYELLLGT